jgi:hypothetical protein
MVQTRLPIREVLERLGQLAFEAVALIGAARLGELADEMGPGYERLDGGGGGVDELHPRLEMRPRIGARLDESVQADRDGVGVGRVLEVGLDPV